MFDIFSGMNESPEAIRTPTYEEVLTALAVSYEAGVQKEDRAGHEAFIKLGEYTRAKEVQIDTCEDAVEAEFRRVEFSFELGKMYLQAGYVKEAKDTILQSLSGALSGEFHNLFQEIHDFFLSNGGTEEEIDSCI